MARGNQKPLFGPADIPGLLGEAQVKTRSLRDGFWGTQLDLAQTLGQVGPEIALSSLPGSGHAWAQGKLPIMEGWDQVGTHPGAKQNLAEGNYGQWAMQRGAQMADGATLAAPVLGPVAGAGVVVGSQGLKNILMRAAKIKRFGSVPTRFRPDPLAHEFKDLGPETLQKARAMRKEGRSPEEIRAETNIGEAPWEPGKPRFEISDARAHFDDAWAIQNSTFVDTAGRQRYTEWDLAQVLDHEALFQAHPDLRYTRFKIMPDPDDIMGGTENVQGWYSPQNNLIVVTPYANDPKSTLLHEIQHWIQNAEGFAGGSNQPDAIKAFANSSRPEKAKVFKQAELDLNIKLADENWLLIEWQRAFTKPKVQDFVDEYTYANQRHQYLRKLRDSVAQKHSAMSSGDSDFQLLDNQIRDFDHQLVRLYNEQQQYQMQIIDELFPNKYKHLQDAKKNMGHLEDQLVSEILEDFSMQKYLQKKSRINDFEYWLDQLRQRDPKALMDYLERHPSGYNYYFRKDGEVEARMVQDRMYIYQDQLHTFPWEKQTPGLEMNRRADSTRTVPDDEILSIDPKTGVFK